ncbi:hypothetical protein [Winogradskyella jejuensis]|uniref:Uncharacterized protein n=1 Tax=Winogradskyella jejuensis TaxID=1089305 RepID=A0A1M5MKS4_9FLAO|nr:hypothetical protein [Winogradskyella jejuensis]SHG77632.1 hypothetical protein SAMN05444148_0919 [Winogradskyella jejuensis]
MNFSKTTHRQESIRITDTKKGIYFTTIALMFSIISVNAQSTPPTPPTPPNQSSGTSYSISIENDDDETHNSSVSISESDDNYKFRASYHKSKNEGVKQILLNKLGKDGLKVNGNTYLWSQSESGDEVFECKLTNGKVRIYLDLEFASDKFLTKLKNMGQDLKYYISGSSKEEEQAKKVERAKRDMERAQRDLERAQRDLERSKKTAKHSEHK